MEKTKKYSQAYVKSVKPPYTHKDILPIALSAILLVCMIIGVSTGTRTLMHSYAAETTPPTPPKVILGNEKPEISPHSQLEQNAVHLIWQPSTDSNGVAGYKIFRNGQQIGDTQNTSYDDLNVSGRLSYTIEAYDSAGKTAKTTVFVNLPANSLPNVTPTNASQTVPSSSNPIGNLIHNFFHH